MEGIIRSQMACLGIARPADDAVQMLPGIDLLVCHAKRTVRLGTLDPQIFRRL